MATLFAKPDLIFYQHPVHVRAHRQGFRVLRPGKNIYGPALFFSFPFKCFVLAYCFTRSVPHSTITGCAEKTGGNYFFCKLLAVSMYFWMSSSKLVVHSTGESGEENNELFSLIVPLLSKSIFFTRLRQRFSENLGSAWKRVGCDNAEEGQRGGDHRVHHALVKVFEAKLGIPLSRHFLFFLFPFSFFFSANAYLVLAGKIHRFFVRDLTSSSMAWNTCLTCETIPPPHYSNIEYACPQTIRRSLCYL